MDMKHRIVKVRRTLYIKVKLAAKEVEETKYCWLSVKNQEKLSFEESLEIQINEMFNHL